MAGDSYLVTVRARRLTLRVSGFRDVAVSRPTGPTALAKGLRTVRGAAGEIHRLGARPGRPQVHWAAVTERAPSSGCKRQSRPRGPRDVPPVRHGRAACSPTTSTCWTWASPASSTTGRSTSAWPRHRPPHCAKSTAARRSTSASATGRSSTRSAPRGRGATRPTTRTGCRSDHSLDLSVPGGPQVELRRIDRLACRPDIEIDPYPEERRALNGLPEGPRPATNELQRNSIRQQRRSYPYSNEDSPASATVEKQNQKTSFRRPT